VEAVEVSWAELPAVLPVLPGLPAALHLSALLLRLPEGAEAAPAAEKDLPAVRGERPEDMVSVSTTIIAMEGEAVGEETVFLLPLTGKAAPEERAAIILEEEPAIKILEEAAEEERPRQWFGNFPYQAGK
jgi:hypothetical protein